MVVRVECSRFAFTKCAQSFLPTHFQYLSFYWASFLFHSIAATIRGSYLMLSVFFRYAYYYIKRRRPPTFMLPGVLAIIASILCLFGGTWCKFISFTEVNNSTDPVTLSYGIWNYLGYSTRNTLSGEQVIMESCNYYPDNSVIIDTKWRSAGASGCNANFFPEFTAKS